MLASSGIFPAKVSGQQTAKYTYDNGFFRVGYLEYLPPDYETETGNFPLLIFLHGGGEFGDGTPESLERVKSWGPPSLIEKGYDMCFGGEDNKSCMIVLSPQKPSNYEWPYVIFMLMEHILNGPERYRIDLDRIYLTGLSRGGMGVYQYAASYFNHPNKLAAIVPIAAWSDNEEEGCLIAQKNLPVWAFHGEEDTIVPYEMGMQAFNSIRFCNKSASPSEMIFTTYEGRYHDSWIPAYDTSHLYHTPNLYEWLLLQTRPENPVTEVSGISNKVSGLFQIYPNPAKDHISLTIDPEGTRRSWISIRTLTGEVISEQATDNRIDITALPRGVYFVQLKNNGQIVATQRLIKM